MGLDVIWAFLTSLLTLRLLMPIAPRLGLLDHPHERRKQHRVPVPVVGGISVFTGLVVSILVTLPITDTLLFGLAGAALLVVVGILDDLLGLGARARLVAQVVAVLILTLGTDLKLDSLGDLFGFGELELGLLAIPFTVFAMVGVINAFNMIDGIDGLAGGIALVALCSLLFLSPGPNPESFLMVATIAATIPYLILNLGLFGYHGGRVFLGDSGSLLLGYLVVWMLVSATQRPSTLEPAAAIWLVAIPLIDTLTVMGRRILKRRSPFSADRGHLHHILSRCLGSNRKALLLLLTMAVLFAIIGLVWQMTQMEPLILLVAAVVVFLLVLAALIQAPKFHRKNSRRNRTLLHMVEKGETQA